MRVLILGGDGYLGWPTAMNLSKLGHEVHAADNYLRRNICREENAESLFDVPNLIERVEKWEAVSGKKVIPWIGDLAEWNFVSTLFSEIKPEAIIHYAEQPSAPYSMMNRKAAFLTMQQPGL